MAPAESRCIVSGLGFKHTMDTSQVDLNDIIKLSLSIDEFEKGDVSTRSKAGKTQLAKLRKKLMDKIQTYRGIPTSPNRNGPRPKVDLGDARSISRTTVGEQSVSCFALPLHNSFELLSDTENETTPDSAPSPTQNSNTSTISNTSMADQAVITPLPPSPTTLTNKSTSENTPTTPKNKKRKNSAHTPDNVARKALIVTSSPDKITATLQGTSNLNPSDSIIDTVTQDMDTIEDLTDDSEEAYQFPKYAQKTTPIIIEDEDFNWKKLQNLFKQHNIPMNKTDGCTAKLSGTHTFTVKVPDANTHRQLTRILDNENVKYHTYRLPADKNLKIVLKRIPIDTECSEIQTALTGEGFTVLNVTQMSSRRDGERVILPLFLITLPRTDKSKEIFSLCYLMSLRIKVESYKGRKGPSQCHRCQQFFHGQSSCKRDPRCVKCAGPHLTSQCNKKFEEKPTCALCGGDHTANWSGCEKRPEVTLKSNNPNTQHNTIQTTRPKLYESRTIVGKSYASLFSKSTTNDNETPSFTPNSSNVVSEAKDIISQLQSLISWIKESNLIELLQTFQQLNSFRQQQPVNTPQPNHG